MEAEIQKKQAELAGADSEVLDAINKQIAQYQQAANDRQIESLKATAKETKKAEQII